MAFFKGDKALQQAAHNRFAHVFLEDVQALREMADIVSQGFESARENERAFGKKNSMLCLFNLKSKNMLIMIIGYI